MGRPARASPSACPSSPSSASTCSTCRRSTRSGSTNRKGANNALVAGPGDPGSPWAIGDESGGHKALHPDLGTIEDFDALVATANEHGMDIALDFAIQARPTTRG